MLQKSDYPHSLHVRFLFPVSFISPCSYLLTFCTLSAFFFFLPHFPLSFLNIFFHLPLSYSFLSYLIFYFPLLLFQTLSLQVSCFCILLFFYPSRCPHILFLSMLLASFLSFFVSIPCLALPLIFSTTPLLSCVPYPYATYPFLLHCVIHCPTFCPYA